MKQNSFHPTIISGSGNTQQSGECHQTSSLIESFINGFVFKLVFTDHKPFHYHSPVVYVHTSANSNVSSYYFSFSQTLCWSLAVIKQLEVLEQFNKDFSGPVRDFGIDVHICGA